MGERFEHDLLGELRLPADSLTGIHAARARANFDLAERAVNHRLPRAYALVKLACARANAELGWLSAAQLAAIEAACGELACGALDGWLDLDALQGGAGTSTNLAVSELLCNRALRIMGHAPGDYQALDPIRDLNRHQSTNDTYPTALRVAAIVALHDLEPALIALIDAFQVKEHEFAGVVKVGRTQLQDACLTTLGRTMGAYADALARDRWRLAKCAERLRTVNLGGTAIGTGLGAPRAFIFRATERLREITGLGLARAENLVEATQNHDALVEVSGMARVLASNLLKICGDLRLLASGPEAGLGELRLPPRQAGSSIMPGKVNPVIAEAVSQAALRVLGHDQTLTLAVSLGNLELNAFLPLVADCLLDSLDLLRRSCRALAERCIVGLVADRDRCRTLVDSSTAALTALVEDIGYEAAQTVGQLAAREGLTLRAAAAASGLVTAEQFDALTAPERVMRLGSPERG